MLTKMKSLFEGEHMQTQNSVLDYKLDLYHKLKAEIDENDHSEGYIDYEIKRKKPNRTRTWPCVH